MKKTNRPLFIIFMIFSVTAVVMRTVGLSSELSPTASAVINASCVVLGLLCLFAGRCAGVPAEISENSIALALTAALLSIGLVVDGVVCTVGFFSEEYVYGRFSSGELIMVLLLFASAAYFALFAAQKAGALRRPIHPLFPIVVPLQLLVRLLLSFMKFTGYANIGENSYSIVMMAAFLWFWMFFSRTAAGISKTKTVFLHTPAIAFYCSALTLLPRLISELASGGMLQKVGFGFSDAATLLFAAALLFDMMKRKKPQKDEEAPDDGEPIVSILSDETEEKSI